MGAAPSVSVVGAGPAGLSLMHSLEARSGTEGVVPATPRRAGPAGLEGGIRTEFWNRLSGNATRGKTQRRNAPP